MTIDLNELGSLLSHDIVFQAPGVEGAGRAACLDFFRGWLRDFPDARLDAERLHAIDDIVVEEGTFTGTHRGRRVSIGYVRMLRLRDGKHVWFRLVFDRLELLEQLGMIPDA